MSGRIADIQAVEADPRGISGVAERMGVSRPYVSRVLSGSMDPVPDKFTDRVLATFARIDCPYLKTPLAPQECSRYARRSYSAITAAEVPHFRACKKCPNNTPEPQS